MEHALEQWDCSGDGDFCVGCRRSNPRVTLQLVPRSGLEWLSMVPRSMLTVCMQHPAHANAAVQWLVERKNVDLATLIRIKVCELREVVDYEFDVRINTRGSVGTHYVEVDKETIEASEGNPF